MKSVQRLLLVSLVLSNLAFVHITEAASLVWLGPLVALTLASPLLIALRHHLAYRLTWNLAVILVFAQLVNHTTSAGAEHLLEDGLLLAALCQVHLLNNIGPDQKPDLLLFNSFLIAVVTSFLSVDLLYSVVFLFYAPALVLSMQVIALTRLGAGEPAHLRRFLFRSGFGRVALVLGVTLLVFCFCPRDFKRRGFIAEHLGEKAPGSLLEVDFSDEIDLSGEAAARARDREVFRVRLLAGSRADVPLHWRGAVLEDFDGRRWARQEGARRPANLGRVRAMLQIEAEDAVTARRFLPLNARYDGIADSPVVSVGELRPSPERLRGRHLALPRSHLVTSARRLASRLALDFPRGADATQKAERMAEWLRTNREYTSPTEGGRATSLDEFVMGEAPGHCEYFATALAVMLRSEGVPCRLATGYRSEEWDPKNNELVVRELHAHAWVEVLDPRRGWATVDPTPPADGSGGSDGEGLFAGLAAAATRLWNDLTGFDEKDRKAALNFLASVPGRFANLARDEPAATAGVPLLVALLFVTYRLRLAKRSPPEVRAYDRALRAARLTARPGETPRELLERARLMQLRERRLIALEAATERHEAARYAVRCG